MLLNPAQLDPRYAAFDRPETAAREGIGAMVSRRLIMGLGAAAGVVAAAGGGVGWSFSRAMAGAEAAVDPALSRVIETRFRALEYAEAGSGPPLLMLHGSGGGFDQGLQFAAPLVAGGYRVIAPSRFGYLRSALPDDASPENQADALVELLDALGVARLPVVGGSAGALSAVQLAIRHPERVSALVSVVPIGHAANRAPGAAMPRYVEAFIQAVLHSDFLFWSLGNLMRDSLVGSLLATDPALLATASAAERQRIVQTLWHILPVSRRAAGVVNDTRLAQHTAPVALEAISAPTLAISAEDDRFGTAEVARTIAAGAPGAELIVYPSGGHLFVGHHDALFGAVLDFLGRVARQ